MHRDTSLHAGYPVTPSPTFIYTHTVSTAVCPHKCPVGVNLSLGQCSARGRARDSPRTTECDLALGRLPHPERSAWPGCSDKGSRNGSRPEVCRRREDTSRWEAARRDTVTRHRRQGTTAWRVTAQHFSYPRRQLHSSVPTARGSREPELTHRPPLPDPLPAVQMFSPKTEKA